MYFTGQEENKDLDKAQNILNELIQENPSYSESYTVLASMYAGLQRYDEAIDIVQQNMDSAKKR